MTLEENTGGDLGDIADGFLRHCRVVRNLSAHTLRAYGADMAEWRTFAGGSLVLESVDRDVLRYYLRYLFEDRGLKETSVKRRMACLKAMFAWAEREELLAISPFHRLGLAIRLPKRLPRSISRHDLQALFRAAENRAGLAVAEVTETSLRRAVADGRLRDVTALVALEVLFATGMRVGELEAVRLGALDARQGVIGIIGKGDRERRVFLPEAEQRALVQAYVAVVHGPNPRQDRALLLTARARPATTQYLRKLIKALGEAARLPMPLTPHMLRHTTATQLLEAGVDIRFVQRLLGHQSIATTEIYTHVTDVSLRGAVEGARVRGRVGDG